MNVFGFGDFVVPTGFGRIGNEVFTRLTNRGHRTFAASIQYDGAQPHQLPFWVASLAGRDIFSYAFNLIEGLPPGLGEQWEVLITLQDFPYHLQFFNGTKIDFSTKKWIIVTPIDGEPIPQEWVDCAKDQADAIMTISRFGVEALKKRGVPAKLLTVGVDTNEFRPAAEAEKPALRKSMEIPEDAFVWGMMAMNQGRKNIPGTMVAFKEFARDKDAYLYLDMDLISPGGWDILALAKEIGIPAERIKHRGQAAQVGMDLRARYCMLDFHSVLAFREGFGLPLVEAMACGIPSGAQDYCSGTEICEDGRGVLVPVLDYHTFGGWGNAIDRHPNVPWLTERVDELYHNREELAHIARTGYDWAIKRTWDRATDEVTSVIQEVTGDDYYAGGRPPLVNTTPSAGVSEVAGIPVPAAGIEVPPGMPGDSNGGGSQPRAGDDEVHPGDGSDNDNEPSVVGSDTGGRLQSGSELPELVHPSNSSDTARDESGELRSEPQSRVRTSKGQFAAGGAG